MAQQYGTVKVDFITFTSGTTGNETDITIPVSGLADIAESGINISGDITGRNITATGNLSVSGQAFFASGIEAAPSITFTGDTNTGLYSPGANQVALSTNGTGRLFVDANGNVGVNTNGPKSFLDVNGKVYLRNSNYLAWHNGFTSESAYLYADGGQFLTFGTAGSERLRITSAGLVGIGTSSPGRTLDVAGTARVSSVLTIGSYIQGTTQLDLYGDSSSSSGVRLDSSGRVGIGTTSPDTNLVIQSSSVNSIVKLKSSSSTNGGQLQVSTTDFILRNRDNGSLQFWTNDSQKAQIDSSGRLLVGTSSSRTVTAGNSGNWNPKLQITKTGVDAANIAVYSFSTYGGDIGGGLGIGPDIVLARSNSNTEGTQSAIANDMLLGRITFNGSDGTEFRAGAYIAAASDGQAWVSGDYPTRLVFSVTADGAASPTEALRISSNRAITVSDGGHIVLGTGTGTKIGTSTSQKIGFFDETPIVQPTTGIAEAAFVENSGGTAVNVDSTFGGYTIQQVVQALQNLGLLA